MAETKKTGENRRKSPEAIADAYSSHPWWYDVRGFFILTFAYRSTVWSQVAFFESNIAKNHLEVAIGTGTLFDLILRWRRLRRRPSARITGIDYAHAMLEGARRRFKQSPSIVLERRDAGDLPYPDETFDSANIANAFHCFPDAIGSLREVLRVLKPSGTLAVNVLLYPKSTRGLDWVSHKINSWGIERGILVTPYTVAEVRKIVSRCGGLVVSEETTGNTYNAIIRRLDFPGNGGHRQASF